MLSARQSALLGTIIKTYIDQAHPIASNQLVTRDGFDVSPATIRNDMAALTEAGYLVQPHTSAGRIPTEKAWRWFIDQEPSAAISKREQAILNSVVTEHRTRQDELMRRLAKTMAELADESVLVAWDRHDTYYTGLANLFSQPEFDQADLVLSLSRVIDRLDDVVARMYDRVEDEPEVLVGRENPFSHQCGVILVRYRIGHRSVGGLIGILGPVRQDYGENLARLKYAQRLLAEMV